ncbi:type I polyketide synthase, partial [Paractinoplanes brasiliensis]
MAADAGTWIPVLRRDREEPQAVLAALAGLHVHGAPVDWSGLLGRGPVRPTPLPAYPFQRERFWPQTPVDRGVEGLAALGAGFWDAVHRQDAAVVLPALASLQQRQAWSRIAGWRYQVGWSRLTLPAESRLSGRWTVIGDDTDEWASALAAAGAEVVDTPSDLDGVVFLPGTGPDCAARLLQVMQTGLMPGRLWVVTRGAVEPVLDPWQGQLWGLGRVFGSESPDRWGGLIDLAVSSGAADAVPVLAGWQGENQVSVRPDGVFGMRLRPAPAPVGRGWQPTGTVLVTGGTGALGARVASWAASEGAERVVLLSRRGPAAPGAAAVVQQLAEAGVAVEVVAADVADRPGLDAVVARIRSLDAVVHTAGVLDDGVIDSLTPDRLAAVARAKVDAVLALDEATAARKLSAFVLFSSVAALAGAAGQGNYAAANAFLDAYAQRRRAEGVPMTAIGWGLWAGAGLADTDLVRGRADRFGMAAMDPAVAVTALAHAMESDGYLAVARADWSKLTSYGTAAGVPAWLSELPEVRAALAEADPAGDGEPPLVPRIRRAPAGQRKALVLAAVVRDAAGVLGHTGETAVEAGTAFRDLGFDSLTGVQLRNRLAAATGLTLPATLVFDYPTPLALAEFLLAEMTGAVTRPEPVTAVAAPVGEPMAIVGMSCRFPGGVSSPEQLWELLTAGGDGIGEFPADRGWDLAQLADGASITDRGGFLDDVAGFDAAFFGISPREATAMDPQQRLLLETSWQALEDAGIDPTGLRGSDTGVYVGTGGQDYAGLLSGAVRGSEGFGITGNATSVISGRLAYTLGLEGPAVSIDTACSSALVAVHLAGQALRSGECSLALAGGVAVMSTPQVFTEFSRQGALSADGRCKAFADAADGTGWSEGVGVVVLERLSDARRNGHQVLAVVRGSAVNQDGASNGLTAPNGPSQQRVIRQALAGAGLAAGEVDAVEAHGTGTTLGDPIEAQALLATYGQGRPADQPLWLGSVKSNIGHTQAAAGAAGLIKMVLAMRHGVLPKTLNVDTPSSHVDWSAGAVRLLTSARTWEADGRPRRAGVSSFGISGTNAHVILEEAGPAPIAEPPVEPPAGMVPWVLSARSETALREQMTRLRGFLAERPDAEPVRVARMLLNGRAQLTHRAVFLGDGREELLDALAGGDAVRGQSGPGAGGVVFVFPGQGAQWVGMGLGLWDSEPVFAAAMTRCEQALAPFVDWSLRAVLSDPAMLERVDVVQPALWAVMVSLSELWRHWGVEPAAVIGHSQGEIAAAVVAGGLSLEDGARVAALRSQAIAAIAGDGGMVSVPVPADEVRPLLEPFGLAVAAVNGPSQVVVAGPAEGCDGFLAAHPGLNARRIAVDYASHTAGMEPLRERLDLTGLTPVEGAVPFFSTVHAEPIDTTALDAAYWYTNLRRTVRFADTVQALITAGHRVFVELSPHPVLVMAVEQAADGLVVTGSLRRDDDTRHRFLRAAAVLHTAGVDVDWAPALGAGPVQPLALPTYPFQHERYWPQQSEVAAGLEGLDAEFWEAVERLDADAVLPALTALRQRRTRSRVAGWRYRLGWSRLTVPGTRLSGRWAVIGDDSGQWARSLSAAGADVVAGELPSDLAGGVVLPGTGPDCAARLLEVMQAWPESGRLWVVTSGAVEPVLDPWQGQLWGLGRVFGAESPDRWGGLIDLADPELAADGVAVLAGWSGETQVAVRSDGVFGLRVRPAPAPAGAGWRPRGTVLVTGGTGALGVRSALWAAEQGADRVVLVSRRGMAAPDAAAAVERLAAAGVTVEVVAVDVANRPALDALVARVPELDAVVHTAGVLDDGVIGSLTPERLATVARSKVDAVIALDEATAGRDLSAFVVFSSMAALAGAPGQGNYAAANGFLDAYAQQRRAQGKPMVSIGWGLWAGRGLADTDLVRNRSDRFGVTGMDPAVAVGALGHALDSDGYLLVADADWARLVADGPGADVPAWMRDLPEIREVVAAADAEGEPALVARVGQAPADQQIDLVLAVVREHAATVLGHADGNAIEAGTAFREVGFDSLTAVELRNRLVVVTGLTLPATLAFDYPTPLALAEFLLAEMTGSAVAAAPAAPVVALLDEPIAIVGMSCRFPGGADSPQQLWDLLAAGGDAVTSFPGDRGWDPIAMADGSATDQGGFLADAAGFDAGFFGISPREALAMDPQQRLLLEGTWQALEDAGIDPLGLRGSTTGVYMGTNGQDYGSIIIDSPDGVDGHLLTGNAASVISGRLAYALGLEGPAVSVDTACSSSLVALHLAGQALRSGECGLALAGGVTVMATSRLFVEFSRQGGMAADGRCKAFADAADGTGWGEGVGVLVLERLSDARRNGHDVLAVMRGSAINQDGASNGISAPNGPAQQRVIRQALANAGLNASDVDAVEAHGTGTRLGDPIEAQALLATYGRDRSADRPLWLGAVKSNIGHTQAAAGVAGVIKMVLAMRHGVLPRTLHVDRPSAQVDWTTGSVRLLTSSRAWESDRPRRAGVSAFGISGTNAHVILEEAEPALPLVSSGVSLPVVPWLVSARSSKALAEQVARLREFPAADAPAVGRALAFGRAQLPHRAVLLGSESVTGVAAPDARVALMFSGQGSQRPEMGFGLYEAFPAYAAAFDAVCAALDMPLRDVIAEPSQLDQTEFTQPALFAVQVALYRLLESWGVH